MNNWDTNFNYQGVALIQVLLLSVILTLLAVQFSHTARQQIESASGLSDRVNAQLLSYSFLSKMQFIALTDELKEYETLPSEFTELRSGINTALPFKINDDIKMQLRDISGMLSLRYPKHPLWSHYLTHLGYDQQEQSDIVNYLIDLQDKDEQSIMGKEPETNELGMVYLNRPFQTKSETYTYLGVWPKLQQKLGIDFHHYADYEVNITHASAELIEAYFGSELAQDLLLLKNEPQKYKAQLRELVSGQFPEETVSVYPSSKKRLSVSVSKGNVLWHESIDVNIATTSFPPIVLIGRDNQSFYVH